MQNQPYWRRLLLRTEETARAYETEISERKLLDNKECPLCLFEGVIQEYEHWILIRNKFPYDRYFTKSDMLVTRRHTTELDVTEEERLEFHYICTHILVSQYDSVMNNLSQQKSIPGHHHVHLIQIKHPDGLQQ